MIELKRAKENPILSPNEDIEWESKAVFNPGAILVDDKVYLLYRAIGEYDTYISRIGLATSNDGVNFERVGKGPIIEPQDDYDKWACEDPSITKVDDTFYITYVALSTRIREGGKPIYEIIHNLNSQTALVTTKDFVDFQRHGIITPKNSDDRDVEIFPEKIDGKFVILHRPHRWCKNWFDDPRSKTIDVPTPIPFEELPQRPSIWISYSSDLKTWTDHKLLMRPRHENDEKIGPGVPPIKTDQGWLVLYHHVEKDENGKIIYTAKAALLDLKDPSKLIAKIPYPILFPKAEYEVKGDVDNVVFPSGAVIKNGELFVYYGTADKYCGLATIMLDEIINELLQCS
ncbi:glycosidase [Patescibacteria group bacterium]|nr:glycosidase [Patescibacteria group bacterium]MBU2219193.1 glycosidase [Patescibacteria group bacterium]